MKYFIIFLLISLNSFEQTYSSNEVKKLIDSLYIKSTETVFIEDMNKPDTLFIVFDNWTSFVVYKQKNYIDNESHRLFQKIIEKGSVQDLELMTHNKYPNIRVYGYWGLIKSNRKNKKDIIKSTFDRLVKDNSKVIFDTFGDLNYTDSVGDLIKKLNKKG